MRTYRTKADEVDAELGLEQMGFLAPTIGERTHPENQRAWQALRVLLISDDGEPLRVFIKAYRSTGSADRKRGGMTVWTAQLAAFVALAFLALILLALPPSSALGRARTEQQLFDAPFS